MHMLACNNEQQEQPCFFFRTENSAWRACWHHYGDQVEQPGVWSSSKSSHCSSCTRHRDGSALIADSDAHHRCLSCELLQQPLPAVRYVGRELARVDSAAGICFAVPRGIYNICC